MTEAIEMKPCPFCNGKAWLRFNDTADYKEHWEWCCGCDFKNKCPVEPFATNKDKAKCIEEWNTRPTPLHSGSVKEQLTQLLLNEMVNPVNMSPWKEGLNTGLLRAIAIVKDFYHDQ